MLCVAVQRKNAARQDEELQSDRRLLERLQQRQAEDEDEDEEEEELQRRDFADTEDVAFYAEKVEAAYRPAEGRGGRADEPSNAGRSRRRQDADRWDAAVSGQRTAGWGETAPAEPQPHRHHDEADDEDAASPPLARGTKRRWMSEEAEQEQQQQQQRVWERERTTLPPQQPFRTEEGQDENEVSAPVAVDGGGEGVAPAPATDGAVSALVDVAWTVDASALSEAALDALLSEAEQTAG